MLSVQSSTHTYSVEICDSLSQALAQTDQTQAHYLIDNSIGRLYGSDLSLHVDRSRAVFIEATEEAKSLEHLPPVILNLLERGLNRSATLTVVGGGVLQDIGCFIASVLIRGVCWNYIPTTLLAQADSCIGSKSSINVGTFKNQVGTFHAPQRVWLVPEVLRTLPFDEIRSGLGEIIKLQLIKGESDFLELMGDLENLTPSNQTELMAKWCHRSLAVKKKYIEEDEFDRGARNLLNYGHTFGHAFESVTQYRIPHGIAVLLGVLTATFLSNQRGLVPEKHYRDLKKRLTPWYRPYEKRLQGVDPRKILEAMARDKKNSSNGLACILTRGIGKMEKIKLDLHCELKPMIERFLEQEVNL